MARAVGLELTPAHVRILSLEQAGKAMKILQFHQASIPAGEAPWEERAAAALKQAFADSKVPRSRVFAALDSGDAILREVSLPFKGDDQVRKTVRFEMESLIHNYTIEQLIVSHYKTGETDKGTLLLAAAVPKAVIEKRLKVYQDAGVDPVALDLDIAAVFNAMLRAGAIDSDEPLLIVHGTPKFTKLALVEGRRPRSIRTIRFSLQEGAAAAPPPPPAEAPLPAGGETIPEETDKLPVVVVADAEPVFVDLSADEQTALVGILSKEISRFLLANAAGSSPARILLSGDFGENGAAELLESATRIPVRSVDLAAAVDPDYKGDGPASRVAVPLGLALKGLGADAMGMDFRQEEFQYTKKFEAVKTTLLVTAELVIVFLAAIALHFYFKKKDFETGLKTVYNYQQALFQDTTGQTLQTPSSAYPRMSELYRQAIGGASADLPIKTSAREAWRDLFNALSRFQQKNGDKTLSDGTLFLELETIDIQNSTSPGNESLTMMMRGKIRNLEFAGLLKNEVRAVETFANADFVGSLPATAAGDAVQFTMKATKGGRQQN
jgi:Tfp pilus assembly PilM family ATPase